MNALPADSPAMAAPQADLDALHTLLERPVDSAERVGSGRNSRVYRVRCGAAEYAAKFYFGPTADGRDRLEVEFSALQFLWQRGLRCIPEPLRANREGHVAVYAYVGGEAIRSESVSTEDLAQLLGFVNALHGIERGPEARALPSAAEAFFTVDGVIRNVQSRLERLAANAEEGRAYDALREFLREAFAPALDRFAAGAEAYGDEELDWRYRTLSPSDLGFHNALRTGDGRVTFLDFEYFGWDDPAKTLCDAELHPQMQLTVEQKIWIAKGFQSTFGDDPKWHDRVGVLYPLFALKWCMITLNEFRPEQIARRRYVDRGREQVHDIQMRQLEAARAVLNGILREHGRFPFWGGGTE